jgi:hypothetical protein
LLEETGHPFAVLGMNRLEPGLGKPAVQRMLPVGRFRRSHRIQLRRHASDFRDVVFARRNALAHSEE